VNCHLDGAQGFALALLRSLHKRVGHGIGQLVGVAGKYPFGGAKNHGTLHDPSPFKLG
jgi:hypothetical protein